MKKLLLLTIYLVLNGCDQHETNSVEYYMEHQDELLVRLKQCNNTTNREEANSEDCNNVRAARSKASLQNHKPFRLS